MLRTICHLGSSNLRLAVEPKRQIELLLFEVLPLMAYDALCTLTGRPWQLQHTWTGVRSCAASMSFGMAARFCCTGAKPVRFNNSPRILTGCPSCQVSCRRCESQRVWPRTVLAVRPVGGDSSFRGWGLIQDALCWRRQVYTRSWPGLEYPPVLSASRRRKSSRPGQAFDVAPSHVVAVIAAQEERDNPCLLKVTIFGVSGGFGSAVSAAGGNHPI